MSTLSNEEKSQVGDRLAKIMGLKPVREFGVKREVRYLLGEGYHTKTALGLYEVVVDVTKPKGDEAEKDATIAGLQKQLRDIKRGIRKALKVADREACDECPDPMGDCVDMLRQLDEEVKGV
jgi:hypothetical protein